MPSAASSANLRTNPRTGPSVSANVEASLLTSSVAPNTPVPMRAKTSMTTCTGPGRFMKPSATVPMMPATVSKIGISCAPTCSCRLPSFVLSLSTGVPAASAAPPNSLDSSSKMIFCAPKMSPVAVSVLICSFCSPVKDTPARDRAVMPLTGSFSAFPSWMLAPLMSVPRAVDISSARPVAWSNMSLFSPTWFLMFVNVSSRLAPDWIISSSAPVSSDIEPAKSPIWSAVVHAEAPVVASTRSVSRPIFADSAAAS